MAYERRIISVHFSAFNFRFLAIAQWGYVIPLIAFCHNLMELPIDVSSTYLLKCLPEQHHHRHRPRHHHQLNVHFLPKSIKGKDGCFPTALGRQ